MLRSRLEDIQAKAPAEREWWEKRRQVIQSDFMKELDEDESSKAATKTGSDDDGVLVDSTTPASTPGKKKARK